MPEQPKSIEPCPRCHAAVTRLISEHGHWRAEPCGHFVTITVGPDRVTLRPIARR